MGGGPSQQSTNTQNQIMSQELANSQQQTQLENQYLQFAQQRMNKGDVLLQPLINRYTALTSGDPNAVISAAGPELGNIARSGQAAKEQIYNTVAPGAGRDVALAQLPLQQNTQTAGYLNNIINNAYTGIGQLGAAEQGLSLQQTGAAQGFAGIGTSQASLAGNTAFNQQQIAAQNKASTMGFLGSLAGAAGGALTGGMLGGFGGGGGGIPSPIGGVTSGGGYNTGFGVIG
jgi:hypothetical protein